MKLTKTASGIKKLTLSKREWNQIGKQAGWTSAKTIVAEYNEHSEDFIEARSKVILDKDAKSMSPEAMAYQLVYIREAVKLARLVPGNEDFIDKASHKYYEFMSRLKVINPTLAVGPDHP